MRKAFTRLLGPAQFDDPVCASTGPGIPMLVRERPRVYAERLTIAPVKALCHVCHVIDLVHEDCSGQGVAQGRIQGEDDDAPVVPLENLVSHEHRLAQCHGAVSHNVGVVR